MKNLSVEDLGGEIESEFNQPQLQRLTDEEVEIRAGNLFRLYSVAEQKTNKYGLGNLLNSIKSYIDGTDDQAILQIQYLRFSGLDMESITKIYNQLLVLAKNGLTEKDLYSRRRYFQGRARNIVSI